MHQEGGKRLKAFSSRNIYKVPVDLPPTMLTVNNPPIQDKCVLPAKIHSYANAWIKFLHWLFLFLSPPSLARLPAISHRHQPLWWSAPCVLMLGVYDRLESNTSSLAVTSSKLGNCGHNEWSRVFCYPCMDGPVHTVLPKSLWGDCTDLYLPLEKEHFLTEILVFLQGRWSSFYVNNVHP